MKKIFILLLIVTFTYAKVDLIAITPGTWIVSEKEEDLNSSDYFNKLSTEAYFSINQFKAYLSLPLAYTYESRDAESQFGLGDISWYVAWQIGMFQPRIGMVVPGIYSLKKSWIGSQDLRLGFGFAVQPHLDKDLGGQFSFEASFFPYISPNFGYAEAGSWDMTTITKGSYCFSNGIHINLELLYNMNSVEWEWTSPDREFKITAVPVFSASYDISSLVELGIKGGAGPTFSKIGDNDMEYSSRNISLGLYCNLNL